MTDLLNIGASGVRAYQSALTTVSENIANVGTAGYTRKSTSMTELASSTGGITARSGIDNNGVLSTGVTRSADAFRSADVRTSSADLSRTETGITWLGRIDTALTGNQLGDRLTGFFNAATAVAADPSATTPRQSMLESATNVATAFTATGKALDAIGAEMDSTADDAVSQLDGLATSLASINDGLARAKPGSSAAAQLADQRDSILERMSALSDVSVTTDGLGRASVKLGGATGPVLVAGTEAGNVTYVRDAAGAASFAVHRAGVTTAVSPGGGVLAGVADGAQRIAGARDQLNAIAGDFTAGVNAVQAQGRDLDGNAGAAMFTTGATATDIGLALTDPRGIAAASVGGGARDNSNLQALATFRTSGKSEATMTALISGNAATLASRRTVADAQSSIRDSAVAARDTVSGVNLDNEAVDLMRFQQAYSASSRVIQVARETFQSILDIR